MNFYLLAANFRIPNSIMSEIPSVTLSNGVKLPLFGLGTLMNKDKDELKQTLETALDAGYRYIFNYSE